MSKYTIGAIKANKVNQFEVIIKADSNDADYITTREFFSEEDFNNHAIDELIELERDYSGSHQLENFSAEWLDIPSSDWGRCHTLTSLEVNYYDNNGSVRPVYINEDYEECEQCNRDSDDCICGDEEE